MSKIILFEFKKFIYNRSQIIYVVAVILLFCATVLTFKTLSQHRDLTPTDDLEIARYETLRDESFKQYQILSGIIEPPDMYTFPPNASVLAKEYYEEYLTYDYYIKTKTTIYDYVNLEYPNQTDKHLANGALQVVFSNLSFFVLAISSIVLSLNIVFSDDDKNILKNIRQSKLQLPKIFFGKVLFFLIVFLLMSSLMLGVFTLFTGFEFNAHIILMVNQNIINFSTYQYFLLKFAVNVSYGLLIGMMTILIRTYYQYTYRAGIISIGIITLMFLINLLFKAIVSDSFYMTTIIKYIPFINSQLLYLTVPIAITYVSINVVVAVIIGIIVTRYIKKLN